MAARVDGDDRVGREPQQGLEALAGESGIGHVLDGAEQGQRIAGVVAQDREVQVAPERGAVGPHVALVDRHRLDLAGEQGGQVLVGGGLLFGVGDGDDIGLGDPWGAEQLASDPVGEEVAAVERGERVRHGRVLEHGSPEAVDPEPPRQHGQVVGWPRWVCRAVHGTTLGRPTATGGRRAGRRRACERPGAAQLDASDPPCRALARSRMRRSRPRL